MRNNKYVVLYVDDDQDMLDSARMVLEANDFIMEEASSAEKGTRKFKECNPDFIIVDLMMEEVDSGINCVKEMKLLGNKAPVFMLSSVGDNLSNMTDTSELGLAGVFQKPLEPEKLIKALKSRI
jgi:two-component system, chemotaxis family, chemotaxis protein CheY